jgi:hypothetical protein
MELGRSDERQGRAARNLVSKSYAFAAPRVGGGGHGSGAQAARATSTAGFPSGGAEEKKSVKKKTTQEQPQPKRTFVPTGSKSTANEEPAPNEEMQRNTKQVDEFRKVNDIDNELKIRRRWVIYQCTSWH